MSNPSVKLVLRPDLGKTPVQRSLLPGQLFYVFVESSGEAAVAGSTTRNNASTFDGTSLRRRLLNHAPSCGEKCGQTGIGV